MQKESSWPDLSKPVDLKVAKISRRHALRILATLGGGAALAWASHSRARTQSDSKESQSQIRSK
jgi:hypothetical protein